MVELYVLGREAVAPEEQLPGVFDRAVYLKAATPITSGQAPEDVCFESTDWEDLHTRFAQGYPQSFGLEGAPLHQQIAAVMQGFRDVEMGVIITPAPVKHTEFWHYSYDIGAYHESPGPDGVYLPSFKPGILHAGHDINDIPYAETSRVRIRDLGLDGRSIPHLLRDGVSLRDVIDRPVFSEFSGEDIFFRRRAWYFQNPSSPKHSKIKAFFASLR